MIGGEQSTGNLELIIVATRTQQNIGDVSPLVRVDGEQRGTDLGKPDKAHERQPTGDCA